MCTECMIIHVNKETERVSGKTIGGIYRECDRCNAEIHGIYWSVD